MPLSIKCIILCPLSLTPNARTKRLDTQQSKSFHHFSSPTSNSSEIDLFLICSTWQWVHWLANQKLKSVNQTNMSTSSLTYHKNSPLSQCNHSNLNPNTIFIELKLLWTHSANLWIGKKRSSPQIIMITAHKDLTYELCIKREVAAKASWRFIIKKQMWKMTLVFSIITLKRQSQRAEVGLVTIFLALLNWNQWMFVQLLQWAKKASSNCRHLTTNNSWFTNPKTKNWIVRKSSREWWHKLQILTIKHKLWLLKKSARYRGNLEL